jgi:hypothetical protein
MDIIFDIDGTLADCEHRRHWIKTKPKNYEAFHAGIPFDPVIEPVAHVMRTLTAAGNTIICCSGRMEKNRNDTEQWLLKQKLHPHALYMRPTDDMRPDDVIKEELLARIRADGFNPVMAFDDRQRVVDMWRRNGIICAQVAEGDF